MNKNEILIQKNSGISLRSKFHIKKLMKHFLTLSYLALAIFVLLQIGDFTSTNAFDKLMPLAMHLIWAISIVFLFLFVLTKSIKILNKSFGGTLFSILFIFIILGISIYISIDSMSVTVLDWSVLIKLINYFLYLMVPIIAWYFGSSFFERKPSAIIAKKFLIKGFSSAFFAAAIYMMYWEFKMAFGSSATLTMNIHEPLQQFLIIGAITLLIGYIVLSLYSYFKWRKVMKRLATTQTHTLSNVLIFFVSAAVFLMLRLFAWDNLTNSYIFIALMALPIILVLGATAFKRSEIKSSPSKLLVYSTAIMMIWITNFIFSRWIIISPAITLPVAILTTAVITLILYFQEPRLKGLSGTSLFTFGLFMFVIMLVMWIGLKGFGAYLDPMLTNMLGIQFGILESMSIMMIVIPLILFIATMFKWIIIIWKVKRSTKVRKIKNKKVKKTKKKEKETKEVINA